MHPKAFDGTKGLVCKLYIQSVSIFWHFSYFLCTLQRWCLRASFSVSFYFPIGQWTYLKNWDEVGCLVTRMYAFTSFHRGSTSALYQKPMMTVIYPETPGTSKMWFFAILLTIMTNNSIFDVGRDPEFTIGIFTPYFH